MPSYYTEVCLYFVWEKIKEKKKNQQTVLELFKRKLDNITYSSFEKSVLTILHM